MGRAHPECAAALLTLCPHSRPLLLHSGRLHPSAHLNTMQKTLTHAQLPREPRRGQRASTLSTCTCGRQRGGAQEGLADQVRYGLPQQAPLVPPLPSPYLGEEVGEHVGVERVYNPGGEGGRLGRWGGRMQRPDPQLCPPVSAPAPARTRDQAAREQQHVDGARPGPGRQYAGHGLGGIEIGAQLGVGGDAAARGAEGSEER
jgi:hypothetical protein